MSFIFISAVRRREAHSELYALSSCFCFLNLPPINERQLCSEWDGTISAAKILSRTRGESEFQKHGRIGRGPRPKLQRTCQNSLQMSDANIPGKTLPIQWTSPQARAYAIKTLLSSCKDGMPVNRCVFFNLVRCGNAVRKNAIGVRSTTRKHGVARSRTSDGRN